MFDLRIVVSLLACSIGACASSSDEDVGSGDAHLEAPAQPRPSAPSRPPPSKEVDDRAPVGDLMGKPAHVVESISFGADGSASLGWDGRTNCSAEVSKPDDHAAQTLAMGTTFRVAAVAQGWSTVGGLGRTRVTFSLETLAGDIAGVALECVVGDTRSGEDVTAGEVLVDMDRYIQFGDRAATGPGETPNFGTRPSE